MSDPARHVSREDSMRPEAPAPAVSRGRSRWKPSVTGKLTLLVGLTMTLLLVGLLTGSWFYWQTVLRRQVHARLGAIATSRADRVKGQIALLLQRAELQTDRGEVRAYLYELATHQVSTTNRDSSQVSLDRMANGAPILSAALADNDGIVRLSTDPAELNRSYANDPTFNGGLTAPHLGLPYRSGDHFEARLAAPIRTRSDTSRTYGVLMAIVDLSQIASALGDRASLGSTGESLLAVREGDRLRFLFPPAHAPAVTDVALASAPALRASFSGEKAFATGHDYRGVSVLAVGRPLGYGGWGLTVKMDAYEAYASIRNSMALGAVFGVLMGGAGLAAAYAVARGFTLPLRHLEQAAAQVASGSEDITVPVDSDDEFGKLSASFNAMTADLRAQRLKRDRAEQALRVADRRKDEFLAILGHELRNPLSAIAHAVQLWKNAPADPRNSELALAVIERQTSNLSRHVEDLLDVVRVSEGKIELRKEPVDLAVMISRAVDSVRAITDERKQHIETKHDERGRWHLDADPTRIEQIISNLLTNAAKYTPEGGRITVEERYVSGEAVLTVADNGSGISPELMPVIFDLFTQGDSAHAHFAGGLGIGLNLCRQLVKLHGGTISAASDGPGCGATFTVRLPARSGPAPSTGNFAPPAFPATNGDRRRILLVDDNEDSVRLLSKLLTRRGHEVTTATDGLAALEMAHALRPDVFLLDIGLPGLDGYELAQRLRAEGFAETPLIALSGFAQDDDQARAFAAGFDHHFAKPVDFDALSALLVAMPVRKNEGGNPIGC